MDSKQKTSIRIVTELPIHLLSFTIFSLVNKEENPFKVMCSKEPYEERDKRFEPYGWRWAGHVYTDGCEKFAIKCESDRGPFLGTTFVFIQIQI